MPESLSRRDLLVVGVATSLLMSQASSEQPAQAVADKLLDDARSADADNVAQRMKFSLPENSEPCFTYVPVDRQVRKR